VSHFVHKFDHHNGQTTATIMQNRNGLSLIDETIARLLT